MHQIRYLFATLLKHYCLKFSECLHPAVHNLTQQSLGWESRSDTVHQQPAGLHSGALKSQLQLLKFILKQFLIYPCVIVWQCIILNLSDSKQKLHYWREVSLANNHPLLPGGQSRYDRHWETLPCYYGCSCSCSCLFSITWPVDMNAKGVVLKAFDQYRLKTCIDFTPWKGEQNYISVFKGSGWAKMSDSYQLTEQDQAMSALLLAAWICLIRTLIYLEFKAALSMFFFFLTLISLNQQTRKWGNYLPRFKMFIAFLTGLMKDALLCSL